MEPAIHEQTIQNLRECARKLDAEIPNHKSAIAAQINILCNAVEEMEAVLDGDPNQTETPETRRAWRQSAVRYADKVEKELEAEKESHAKTSKQVADWNAVIGFQEKKIERLEKELAIIKDRRFPIMKGPSIPWMAIAPYDLQAQSNHGRQTLERLAERGGLAPCEAVAIMECRKYTRMDPKKAIARMLELVSQQ